MRHFLEEAGDPHDRGRAGLGLGGRSYREIAAEAQASPTTVVRVARFLKEMPHQGYRLVLDRLKA